MNVIEKLKELGIVTTNTYPKKSFVKDERVVVSLYERELKEDFYFFNSYDKILYKIPQDLTPKGNYEYDNNTGKFLIPIELWKEVWKDEPFVELPDITYREMTVRQFACITLRVPESGTPWLDELIKKSNDKTKMGAG